MWHHIRQPLTTLLNEEGPVFQKQAAILALPHLPWWNPTIDGYFIQLWAEAAWAVPYTEDVGQCVADTIVNCITKILTATHSCQNVVMVK